MNKFFVEVGSADFNTLLKLSKNGWDGIIVEPNTELINNLEILDNVIYENVALVGKGGVGINELMYYDTRTTVGSWRRGTSAVRPRYRRDINLCDVFDTEGNYQWRKDIRTQEISCITLDTLLEKHNVNHIDFMKVDTEGSEYKIFESYSWNVLPDVLVIEISHWKAQGMTIDDIIEFALLLDSKGYFLTGAIEIDNGSVEVMDFETGEWADIFAVR